MESVWTSEMLVSCYNTAWHYNPEDLNLDLHHSRSIVSIIWNNVLEDFAGFYSHHKMLLAYR